MTAVVKMLVAISDHKVRIKMRSIYEIDAVHLFVHLRLYVRKTRHDQSLFAPLLAKGIQYHCDQVMLIASTNGDEPNPFKRSYKLLSTYIKTRPWKYSGYWNISRNEPNIDGQQLLLR